MNKEPQTCPYGGGNHGDIKVVSRKKRNCFGNEAIWYRVQCTCGACGQWAPSKKEAIGRWNSLSSALC